MNTCVFVDLKEKGMHKAFCLLVVLFAFVGSANTQEAPSSNGQDCPSLCQNISPFFAPPTKYRAQYGSYRSPLKFYNGKEVKTAKDWERRRKEIKDQWMKMMGAWPPLLTEQKMTLLDSTQKEGFVQYKVHFRLKKN